MSAYKVNGMLMKTPTAITLSSGKVIGHGHPCFIVAEIGNNHQGNVETAKKMVRKAREAGVDAVKFQKRHTQSLLTREGLETPYTGPNSFGPTYGEHRDALELDIEEMAELKAYTEEQGLVFFVSAWDMISLEQIRELGVELMKIASAEITSIPILRRMASMGIPIIASTGMSTWDEIDRAMHELAPLRDKLVLLHCNSSYPCDPCEIALPVMDKLRERYEVPVGYSGHERGIAPSVAAVARGACVVERHFTLSKDLPGTDHKASLEPHQLAEMVSMIREVEQSMGVSCKRVTEPEKNAAAKLRKSIIADTDLPAGTVISEEHITVKCPGTGISPAQWDDVLGKTLTNDLSEEDQLSWDVLK